MLPDSILPTPEDDIARILADYEKRLSHLERLENFESDIGARVFNSANISIPDFAVTTLTFDSERFDTDAIHSATVNPGRLTARTAGKYVIVGHVAFATNAIGDRQVGIRLNGITDIGVDSRRPISLFTTQFSVPAIYELSVNDYVELRVFQNSGGALNVVASGNISPEFSMMKVG